MECKDVQPQLADYLDGSLAPGAADAVSAHLGDCPSCSEEAEQFREAWRMLGAIPTSSPDSASMRARLDAAVAGYEHGLEDARGSLRKARLRDMTATWRPQRFLAQAAAAAVLLAAGVVAGRETAPAPVADGELSAVREELRDMRQLVTLSLLQQQSASERLKGVTWTGQIDQPGGEVVAALLQTLMHDSNVNVRLATIDALRRVGEQDVVRSGAVEALERQTSPLVQIALIDFLVEVNARASSDALRRLSEDPMFDDAVRAHASWGLRKLG